MKKSKQKPTVKNPNAKQSSATQPTSKSNISKEAPEWENTLDPDETKSPSLHPHPGW